MSATSPPTHRHPVAVGVARLNADLGELLAHATWSMDTEETDETLLAVTTAISRLQAVALRVAAHADTIEVGAASGAGSTQNWWAHQTRLTRAETHRLTRLAKTLEEPGHEPVAATLAAGEIRLDQAQVIVDAVDDLPEDLDAYLTGQDEMATTAEVRAKAERFLLEQAVDHDAKALRVLGRRLLEVISPEAADAYEADRLAKEEAKAQAAARLTMSDDGHGKTHGRFTLPTAHAAMLRKALLAIAAPKHQTTVHGAGIANGVRKPSAERMGSAFCEYLERYPADRLPQAGGVNATIVVTIPVETLTGGLKAAALDTGERISAGQARRLACEAQIIPVVLGGDSMPLDYGRTRRFHTAGQRIVLGVRDGGCTAMGCDAPPAMTQVHHDPAWSAGGGTDLEHARLLCPRHHRTIHDPAYQITRHPEGKVSFHRRT